MFAITGITGKVGAAVARSLLSDDQPVRAVVRDRSKGAAWAQLGCDIAVADISDTAALATAFEGTAGAFVVLPPGFRPPPPLPPAAPFFHSPPSAPSAAQTPKGMGLAALAADAPHPE